MYVSRKNGKSSRQMAMLKKKQAKKMRQRIIAVLLVLLLIGGAAYYYFFMSEDSPLDVEEISYKEGGSFVSEDKNYAVSSSNALATKVGAEVLENGGNAVDAAVAVSYALSVVEFNASGIGGGGVMLIYDPKTDAYYSIDFRETGTIDSSAPYCVPGLVKGMETANEKFGTVDLAELIEPARKYAAEGFKLPTTLAGFMSFRSETLKNYSQFVDKRGNLLEAGDTLIQSELAETLATIQKEGSDSFYTGSIAKKIVKSTAFTEEDLSNYEVIMRDPPTGQFMDYEVVSTPAPSAGVTLIQMLKMADMLDIPNPDEDLIGYMQQLSLIENAAYADRVSKISDPTRRKIDEKNMVSDEYVQKLLQNVGVEFTDDPEHISTTHFSIIDKNGMVVSCTQTLRSFFGSKKMTCGFFLNNGMEYFGNGSNVYEPGKRARNFCSPAIIRGDDGYAMAIGTPGGNYIPKIMFPIILDCLKFGTEPVEAVDKGRVVFKSDTSVWLEESDNLLNQKSTLNKLPYSQIWIEYGANFGSVQIVGYDPETKKTFAAADKRREGDVESE